MKKQLLITLLLASTGSALLADAISDAKPIGFGLTGTTSTDEWTTSGLPAAANPGFPGFPGSGAWPNPIGSNVGGDATLMKTANGTFGGGPYPGGGSIYFGSFNGTANVDGGQLTLTDTTPVFDLKTVVLQIEIGQASGFDFYNGVFPTLSYNGGSQNLVVDFSKLITQAQNGTFTTPDGPEPIYINLWGLQWDLSGISDPITSYSISFNGVQHSQVYALRLDATDAIYTTSVVPEPHEYATATAALLFALVMVRSLRKRATA